MSDFPSLERMTADISTAMHSRERERFPRRLRSLRGWLLATAALATLAVPTAYAVQAITNHDRVISFPGMRGGKSGHPATKPTGATVALASGAIDGHHFVFAGQRCGTGDRVSIAFGFVLGSNLKRSGSGADQCPRRPRRQPVIHASYAWAPGQSWIFGIVQGTAMTVDIDVVRQRRNRPSGGDPDSSRIVSSTPIRTLTRTHPFNQAAVRQGNLPPGYRYFVLFQAKRSAYTRLTAHTTNGDTVIDCTIRQCDSLARRGR